VGEREAVAADAELLDERAGLIELEDARLAAAHDVKTWPFELVATPTASPM
jgi:hypothetical protein